MDLLSQRLVGIVGTRNPNEEVILTVGIQHD